MLHSLPSSLRAAIAFGAIIANTLFWAGPLFAITLLRILMPVKAWQKFCTAIAIAIAECWISVNCFTLQQTQAINWQVMGLEQLDKKHWYFVTANHQSWADILIVQYLLNRKIPMLKFFLKQELIWVPVIGLCWWALDFPFMKRYSQAYLAKHPEKRGQDLLNTQKACEKFKSQPVAIFNFLEGTRFTEDKRQQQNSPYRHLLKPKAGGMAFVLGAMGENLHSLIDVTICYPNNQAPSFWQFLQGKTPNLTIEISCEEIPSEFLNKDYANDAVFKQQFQQWVNQLWQQKDDCIERHSITATSANE
jgi:1-acyl-sn-glycerol-3-phosphate acyltransferase